MESDAAASEIEQILNLLIGEGVVAYQRGLARAIGCHSAGLLLSQFWYWTQRLPEGRDGWFHKTMPEIEQETVMGRREQDSARKKLRDLGLLEEKKQGQPAKLWFRLNRRGVVELLRQDARKRREISAPEPSLQSDLQFGAFRQTRLAESAKLLRKERIQQRIQQRVQQQQATPWRRKGFLLLLSEGRRRSRCQSQSCWKWTKNW